MTGIDNDSVSNASDELEENVVLMKFEDEMDTEHAAEIDIEDRRFDDDDDDAVLTSLEQFETSPIPQVSSLTVEISAKFSSIVKKLSTSS